MQLRQSNIERLRGPVFDALVIGGGVNGAVSAAALSAKGAKVALIDKGDFAGLVSENSSNLAWGGIKYLESYEFSLVLKLCKSRNRLMRAYPSTVQEVRFFTTIAKGFRHWRLTIWLGAWLYWLMGRCFTGAPRLLSRRGIARQEPSIDTSALQGGIEYSDAYFHDNDARFVFNFVRAAMNYGCIAVNYMESVGGQRLADNTWEVQCRDRLDGTAHTVRARTLINACGPLVDEHNRQMGITTQWQHVLSKGVHLVVPRLTDHRRVLTFFANDGRMFFAIPMGMRTCIGTTDSRVDTPYPKADDADIDFILDNINQRLRRPTPLSRADIIAVRCGVRPLAVRQEAGTQSRDWTQLSRRHAIEVDTAKSHLSIFGGKLTDCLNVGDEVSVEIERLGVRLPFAERRWYGEPPAAVRDEFMHQARLMQLDALGAAHASEPLSQRLWRRYGGNAIGLLEDIRGNPRQAEPLIEGAEYVRCEIEQTARREMVSKLEDFLRRRSKIALMVPEATLRQSVGLKEACRIFFGGAAEAKWQEYFDREGER